MSVHSAALYWNHMGTGWGVLMMVSMVLILMLVVFGLVWLTRSGNSLDGDTPGRPDRRLVEDDLSLEDHERRRSATNVSTEHPPAHGRSHPSRTA